MALPDWWTGRGVRSGGPQQLSDRGKPGGGAVITGTVSKPSPSFTNNPNHAWANGYTGTQFGTTGVIPRGPDQPPPSTNRPGGPTRPDPYAEARAAQAKAEAEAAAAMARAGNRAKEMAGNLDPQIAALKHALEVSFAQARDQNLKDIQVLLDEQFAMLKTGAEKRGREFRESGKNSEIATAGQAESSLSNLVRERQDTMSAVLEQGAGQTDALRALLGSARNWQQNAQEGNRAYFDSIQSLNQSITDLNLDAQTALGNAHTQAESERERQWQDYYNRRSESFTQLGNLYTQQADYLEQAKENKVGTGGGDKKGAAGTAFMDAAKESALSYEKQGLPDWIKDYEGEARIEAKVQNTNLAQGPRLKGPKKAEGSTLRKWS